MSRQKMLKRLKISCIVTGILGVLLFFGVGPAVVMAVYPATRGNWMIWVDFLYISFIGALCFTALYDAWKICREIGADNSFSMVNVYSLERISTRMKIACVLLGVGWVYMQLARVTSDAMLSLIIMGLLTFGVFIALVLALFASALAGLIREGEALKQENELTI